MRLELIDSLSLPGNPEKPNEDALAHTDRMATVFDGVTSISESLMPGPSDPAWLAQFAARRLAAHSRDGGEPREWIALAAGDASKSFNALRRRGPKERYEIPYASLMVAAAKDGELEALWLGDCAAIVKSAHGDVQILGDTIESRVREREFIAQLASAQGLSPVATLARGESNPQLRARRNVFNTAKGPWLFAPDARCAKHVRAARTAIAPDAVILLATDGFLALITDYARYTTANLFDAIESKGLAALGEELRAIEAADPEGVIHPRFKPSDDATALLLRVA